jgi:serine/threonine-protein kinase 19
VVRDVTQPVIEKDDMSSITASETKQLIQMGLLAGHRMVGKFLLSFPGCGTFISTQTIGRKAVLRMIRGTKFKEILESELWKRKLPLSCRFDVKYFTADLLGSEEVTVVRYGILKLRCFVIETMFFMRMY